MEETHFMRDIVEVSYNYKSIHLRFWVKRWYYSFLRVSKWISRYLSLKQLNKYWNPTKGAWPSKVSNLSLLTREGEKKSQLKEVIVWLMTSKLNIVICLMDKSNLIN